MFSPFAAMSCITSFMENMDGLDPVAMGAAADDGHADRRRAARRPGDHQDRPARPDSRGHGDISATEVIVGNAPVELADVASGLHSTVMQVGGATRHRGARVVMSAKVSSELPVKWAASYLPALSPAQLAEVKSLITIGVTPPRKGTPDQIASPIAVVTHGAFISGMSASFLVVGAVPGAALDLVRSQHHAVHEAVGGHWGMSRGPPR
jgi:hypothetical protein